MFVFLFILASAQSTQAATFNPGCTAGVGDVVQLQADIASAGSNSEVDTINLAGGCTYTLTTTLTINSDGGNLLTINGNGATISGNNAVRVLYINSSATVMINNLTINGGRADGGSGGGISNLGGALTLTNSTVSGNSAYRGGGIANLGGGVLTLTNSTVSVNSASSSGGGIFSGAGGMLTLTNSTVSGNSAGSGGGISNSGTLTLNNGIVANNSAISGSDCSGGMTASYSLVEDGSCGVVDGVSGNRTGDPNLGTLTGNPAYYPLLAGSIAINAGDNTLVPPGVTTDQAGNPRVQGGTVDMGSFESSFVPIATTVSISPASATIVEGSSTTLTVARTGDTINPLAVDFMRSGTASPADYILSVGGIPLATDQVTISAGLSSVDILVETVDNTAADGERMLILTIQPSAAYEVDVANGQAEVTLQDNDAAGITVSPTSGLVTTEAGGTATFTVVLNSQPTADVILALSSSDPTEGTLDIGTFTFTDENWNTAQTITITGVDDAVADGAIAYTITTAAAVSSDGNYSGLDPADVSVTNMDDDTAGITITPAEFTLTEGDQASYLIALLGTPSSAPVTLQLDFASEHVSVNGSASPVTLDFSDTTPQMVTIVVLTNPDDDANRTITITHIVSASGAAEYPVGLPAATVTIHIDDAPPPPPSPTCETGNSNENGGVRTSIPDALRASFNCRSLYQDGQPTTWLGAPLYSESNLGVAGLLDLGVLQAVDIFSPSGQTYFDGGGVFCLRGSGSLIWLAASGQPRHAEIIGSYTVPEFPGFTCATLFEPGTLVLVANDPLDR
jgi:hypothetical protein